MSLHPYQILVRPLLTERAAGGAEKPNKEYHFRVALTSNKVQIRRAIEAAFAVKVLKVRTIRMKGKTKQVRAGKLGKRPDWKKTIITLAEGQAINLI